MSMKNGAISIITNILTVGIGFIAQAIFVRTLGSEYLGVNGLFSNIISVLGIVELGIGTTIIYHLYKPIAQGDIKLINQLMNFYKKSYRIIAFIIAVLGILLIPFLNIIVGTTNIKENIYVIFLLFLIDIVFSYLLTYKRSILYANQETYIVNIIHIGYLIFMNLFQIIILLSTMNYILFLGIKIFFRVLENIIITIVANKKYSYIKERNTDKLDSDIVGEIIKKVKSMFFHKIGDIVVLGTSNIIISTFLGVSMVGVYSNYTLITNALNNLLSQMYGSIVSSVGNLLTENNSKKAYKIYLKMSFINKYIAILFSAMFICLIEPFITIWVGEQFLLSKLTIVLITLNFYIHNLRNTMNTYKSAAGIFYEDRFVPIIIALVDIILSVVLVNVIGINGVFIGIIIATLIYHVYDYPKYVYNKIFERLGREYIKQVIQELFLFLIIVVSSFILINFVNFDNIILNLFVRALLCFTFVNIMMIIIFRKKFRYIFDMIKSKILD